MRIRPGLAAVMTFAATAAAMTVADPALALNQKTCQVKYDGVDRDCITQTLDLAGSNVFHIGTTGAPTDQAWLLIVTDVHNGKVVVTERIWNNANVWRTNVYSDYTAYASCNRPCPGLTLYFANG
ncbi:hypothetical protein [Actinoplanes teichomyceticus]|uniref:Uncharacterized protein n=1 Tax=Actinoplanes teichomyceticus TaxID=1867 RepID=A0A561VIZ4_ACTTI|nr:hypothetical protein [Actinoplanes teichomyceticus]TWG11605.1 hypothetical protein FHX34_106335 [Actinoplanes teichomyceticus]GIF16053.1 hypothetical protein Ate01nite_60850 [Actinoplanes teichomyceticus]